MTFVTTLAAMSTHTLAGDMSSEVYNWCPCIMQPLSLAFRRVSRPLYIPLLVPPFAPSLVNPDQVIFSSTKRKRSPFNAS